jgi:transposase
MSSIFKVNVLQKQNRPVATYCVGHDALQNLTEHRLGKTILITDHLNRPTAHVIEAYRNPSLIEQTFKNMKNLRSLRWQPAYHWEDRKLRVHILYCVLAPFSFHLSHIKMTARQAWRYLYLHFSKTYH